MAVNAQLSLSTHHLMRTPMANIHVLHLSVKHAWFRYSETWLLQENVLHVLWGYHVIATSDSEIIESVSWISSQLAATIPCESLHASWDLLYCEEGGGVICYMYCVVISMELWLWHCSIYVNDQHIYMLGKMLLLSLYLHDLHTCKMFAHDNFYILL